MAKLGFEYSGDTDSLNDNSFDRQPLPEGEYLVNVMDSDYKPTKKGDGHYVAIQFEVTEGPHEGRYLWSNYNIDNPNPQAQEIGEQQFAKLCLATLGKPSCGDTDDLLGKRCLVGVGFEKNDPSRNRVKYANPVSAGAAATAPAASPAAVKKPWQK